VGGVGGVVIALTKDDDELEDAAVGWEGFECGEGDDGGPLKYEDATTDSLERLNRPPEPNVGDVVGI
jgi:hypothetical protein